MTELAAPQISSLMEALPGIAAVLRSPVASAIASLVRAGVGLEEFRLSDADELLKFGVRRNLLTQDEVDRLFEEVREVADRRGIGRPAPAPEKPKAAPPKPKFEAQPAQRPAFNIKSSSASARPAPPPAKPVAAELPKPVVKPVVKPAAKVVATPAPRQPVAKVAAPKTKAVVAKASKATPTKAMPTKAMPTKAAKAAPVKGAAKPVAGKAAGKSAKPSAKVPAKKIVAKPAKKKR